MTATRAAASPAQPSEPGDWRRHAPRINRIGEGVEAMPGRPSLFACRIAAREQARVVS